VAKRWTEPAAVVVFVPHDTDARVYVVAVREVEHVVIALRDPTDKAELEDALNAAEFNFRGDIYSREYSTPDPLMAVDRPKGWLDTDYIYESAEVELNADDLTLSRFTEWTGDVPGYWYAPCPHCGRWVAEEDGTAPGCTGREQHPDIAVPERDAIGPDTRVVRALSLDEGVAEITGLEAGEVGRRRELEYALLVPVRRSATKAAADAAVS